MKIAIINSFYYPDMPGGAEVSIKALAEGLAKDGNDVHVICLSDGSTRTSQVINAVKVHRIPLTPGPHPLNRSDSKIGKVVWHLRDVYRISIYRQIANLITELRPDIASCHNIPGLSVAVWKALRDCQVPIIQVLHDQYLLCTNTTMFRDGAPCRSQCAVCKCLRTPHKQLSNSVSGVIGVSQFILDRMAQYEMFSEVKNRRVIRNTRPKEFWMKLEENHSSNLAIGYIGSITPQKGVENLLVAFSNAKIEGSINLLIAGGGKEDYINYLKEKYKSKAIKWLGRVDSRLFYSKINLLVVPSIWDDTLPGVVFEALGLGIPVFGANRGGIPEMIQDARNGVVYEAENTQELSGLITKFVDDADWRKLLSNGTSLLSPEFTDSDSWVGKYEKAYAETISAYDGSSYTIHK